MSLSLLKRSLAIVEEQSTAKKRTKLKDKQDEPKRPLPSNRKGNTRKHPREPERVTIADIKARASKAEQIEKNIAKLQMLSKTSVKIDAKSHKKIIERVQAGHYVIPKEEKKKKEESIFTEEDFKKFEREYFG